MARTIKEGFTYFPLDTDAYENRKIRRLLHSQGGQGYAVWVVTMQLIFGDKGYYIQFNQDTCFDIGDKVAVSEGTVEEILRVCLKLNLFDKKMYEKFGILTSKGIQKQFEELVKVTKRKTSILPKFRINSEETGVSSEEIAINSEEMGVSSEFMQQSKVKESKVKENKVKDCNPHVNLEANSRQLRNGVSSVSREQVAAVLNFYQHNFGVLSNYIQSDLMQWCQDLSPELAIKALELTLERQRNYNYAKGIMQNWLTKKIKTLTDVEAEQVQFQRQAKRNNNKPNKQEIVPYWAKEQLTPMQPKAPQQTTSDVPSEEELRARTKALFDKLGENNDKD